MKTSHDLSISKASFMHSLSTSNSCRFWSYVKLTRKSTASIPPLASSDNTLSPSDQDKANILNKAFCSFFNHSLPPLDAPVPLHNHFFPPEFLWTPAQVSQLIHMLSSVTACGSDEIPAKFLKSTSQSICIPLSLLFNSSLQQGIFPVPWKQSKISAIPKTSPPSISPTDYRPISLLPIVSKLLERHVFNILIDICLDCPLISDCQFGFLPKRSTAGSLLYATHSISSSLDKNVPVCGIFLDLKKHLTLFLTSLCSIVFQTYLSHCF